MPRWSAALLLAVLLLVPAAAAFSSTPNDLRIAYDASAAPVVVAAGEVTIEGAISGGFFVGGSTGTRLERIPRVLVVERDGDAMSQDLWTDVTIEIGDGGALWRAESGALQLDAAAPYAVGLALPRTPIPTDGAVQPSGFLLAGEGLGGAASWSGEPLDLLPLDALVTVRDARGQPLPDWDGRRVNQQAGSVTDRRDGAGLDVSFRLDGPFNARVAGAILGGAAATGTDAALTVRRADEDRFSETVALLRDTSAQLGAQGETFAQQQTALELLEQMSGLLNGALLLVGSDGTTPASEPLLSRWGDSDFELGAFNVMRGDGLSVAWADGEMRLAGEPTVALGRDGFAIEPPMRVGLFPLVSLVLWALAIAAIVWWFVQRPPKVKPELTYRLLSFGAYALVLLLTLYLWDRSFTQTFGTGVLQVAREQGVSPATLPQLGVLLAFELIPWSIAALLFALPVRIALGVCLQRLGRGKSFKGLAGAGGLVALAIFGPIYALWCFNLVWSRAGPMIGG